MPVSKKDLQWKDYEQKDTLYRGIVLEIMMNNKDSGYTLQEVIDAIKERVGPDAAKSDRAFEGNVRAALLDPRIAMTLMDGVPYYSLKDNPPTR
jgi:hypothetical protein